MTDAPVDHYVWEGYYIPNHWDDPKGNVFATTKVAAMQLVAEEADVPNAGWEENDRTEQPCYQLNRTVHHIVTVRRVPVYGARDDGGVDS